MEVPATRTMAERRIHKRRSASPRKVDPIEKIVAQLNRDYGIGIQVPDVSVPVDFRVDLAEEDEEYARWDRYVVTMFCLHLDAGFTAV
ncbi:hypothetical protein QBC47DRAFT_445071 [Echria macrotheca]|uniref:Uncharacterized protein n=1 Tax=Echria macrotheca TaxID=438768 RepID=A0AAJ0FCU4_9PEZI|nr:hypothetical protein QBC47DRAFT_445071 [Echria macrotheca]